MPVPRNKEELLAAVRNNYEKLEKELHSIPPALVAGAYMDGHAKGTTMSVSNLVSYLIGWGELVLKWNYRKDSGKPVDFPETGYKWNELGKLAQKFYKDYEGDDFKVLCKRLAKNVAEILALIERKSNAELYEVAWYGKWTLGRMIQFNTSSPYTNASARIRKWKKAKS